MEKTMTARTKRPRAGENDAHGGTSASPLAADAAAPCEAASLAGVGAALGSSRMSRLPGELSDCLLATPEGRSPGCPTPSLLNARGQMQTVAAAVTGVPIN